MQSRPSSYMAVAGVAAGLCAGMPALAAQTVYWPSLATTPAGGPAPALIGAPDLAQQLGPAQAFKFEQRVDYATLAATMGLSALVFGQYDLILWESNGGAPAFSGGFESTEFVFDDLSSAVTARYDEISNSSSNPAVQFLTGSITGAQYDTLFGTTGATPVMSWLLVDLPSAVDAQSASFNVTVRPGGPSAGGLGEGSPDIDAVGVITSVPEPQTWALCSLGLMAIASAARRRRGAR